MNELIYLPCYPGPFFFGGSGSVTTAGSSIVSATNSGGLVLITTTNPHGMTGSGADITVSGTGLYNGHWSVTVVDATSFTLDASTYSAATTGGSWHPYTDPLDPRLDFSDADNSMYDLLEL